MTSSGTQACFSLNDIIIDDAIIEGTESFLVEIMQTDSPVTISPGDLTVNIEDKDGNKCMKIVRGKLIERKSEHIP